MKRFHTSIQIQAPAPTIWRILTDAPGYVRWNSTVDKVEGRIALGEKVTVHAKINASQGKGGRAFPVKVSRFAASQKMVWTGGMPLGLFKGERTFTLNPLPQGSTEFAMTEVYSGPLASLIGKSIPDLQPAFDTFAADLKRAAEALAETSAN